MAKKNKKAEQAVTIEATAQDQVINGAIAAKTAAMQDMAEDADIEEVIDVELTSPEATATLSAVEVAEAEAKRIKELLASAKAKLAEAKAAQKAQSARPIRASKFHAYEVSADVNIELLLDTMGDEPAGFPIYESDVHYRAEKVAIDAAKNNVDKVYLLYSINKNTGVARLISKIFNSNGIITID